MPSLKGLVDKLFRRSYDSTVNEDYITTDEAAKLSGFTEQYIRKMIREKRIEGQKVRRDWILSRASLERFLATERRVGRPSTIDNPPK
jgi:excisionase family DNA binding protein